MGYKESNLRFYDFLNNCVQIPVNNFNILSPDTEKTLTIEVHGVAHCLILRDFLRKLREVNTDQHTDNENIANFKGLPTLAASIRACTLGEMRQMYKERFATRTESFLRNFSFFDFLKMEVRKLSTGMFEDRLYQIKFYENLESENNFSEKTGTKNPEPKKSDLGHTVTLDTQDIGDITIGGQVVGNERWYFTPAEVEIGDIRIIDNTKIRGKLDELKLNQRNLDLRTIVKIVIEDPFFIESIRLLEYFICKGMLQIVHEVENIENNKIKRSFLQLKIGGSDHHFVKFA